MAQNELPNLAAPTKEGFGNLPPDFYPRSPCRKPPKRPNVGDGIAENMRFNLVVTGFNRCIQSYLENAKRDVAHILDVVNTTAGEAALAPSLVGDPPPSGGSNLPPDFYPHSSCVKPDRAMIGEQPGIHDKAMIAYNARVNQFNEQAAAFNGCLKAYISNARTDLANVQKTLNAAVAGE